MNKLILPFVLLQGLTKAFAFPEMIRHGYKSCTTCHISVAGGEMLTPYGKSLAQELLSQQLLWPQKEIEDKSQDPEPLVSVGGHLRALQVHRDNSQSRSGRFLLMQVEADLYLKKNLWGLYTSIARSGVQGIAQNMSETIDIPETWLQYISSEDDPARYFLRFGKFLPTYGINISEHAYVNRRVLGLGPGKETLNAEIAFESDYSQIVFGLIEGSFNKLKLKSETGISTQISWIEFEGIRFGVNLLNQSSQSEAGDRFSVGAYSVFSWSKKWAHLFQIDKIKTSNSLEALSIFSKFNFELDKGVNLFSTQEYANDDLRITNPHFEAIGFGIQYFPVANVDILLSLRQEKNTAISNEADSILWLLGHLYL